MRTIKEIVVKHQLLSFLVALSLFVAVIGGATDSLSGFTQVIGISTSANTVKMDSTTNTVKIDGTTNTVKMDASTNTVKETVYSTATTVSSSSAATAAPITQQTGRHRLIFRISSASAPVGGANEVWVNIGGSVGTVSSGLLVTYGEPLDIPLGTVAACYISSTTIPIAYTSLAY